MDELGQSSFGSFVVDVSSRFKRRNSLDLDKSTYLYNENCDEIASNAGTNYSAFSDNFDDEPAPDFGRLHQRQFRRNSLDQSYSGSGFHRQSRRNSLDQSYSGSGFHRQSRRNSLDQSYSGIEHNQRQSRRHSLDQSYSSFNNDQYIVHAQGFGCKQNRRRSLDDSYQSFDIDNDSERHYFPLEGTTRTASVRRLSMGASYTTTLAEEPTSMPPKRRASMEKSNLGQSRSLRATTQLLPSSVGTYVIDMPDDFNTDSTPPVYTASPDYAVPVTRNVSTRRMQRRGTMDTARTTGTQGSDDFRTIPSGDEDSDEEDNKAAFGAGVFLAVKFGMTLLRKIRQDDEEDEIADALESGKRNLHRARSTEQMFVDISPKIAPPPSMLEYVVL
jgi:hypothetical protein